MDKFLLRYIALCLVILLLANIAKACETATVSDEEIMDEYISSNYDEECYGTLQDRDDDEYIEFVIHKTDGERCSAAISRDHYMKQIIE